MVKRQIGVRTLAVFPFGIKRQQIAAGDLKEAGATLERILLLNPTLYDVRVLYGLVLYRLGLYDRARYELELALESGEAYTQRCFVGLLCVCLDMLEL